MPASRSLGFPLRSLDHKPIIFLDHYFYLPLTLVVGVGADRIVAFYDAVLDVGIVTDVNIVQDDGVLMVQLLPMKAPLNTTESSTVPFTILPDEIRLLRMFAPTLYFAGGRSSTLE